MGVYKLIITGSEEKTAVDILDMLNTTGLNISMAVLNSTTSNATASNATSAGGTLINATTATPSPTSKPATLDVFLAFAGAIVALVLSYFDCIGETGGFRCVRQRRVHPNPGDNQKERSVAAQGVSVSFPSKETMVAEVSEILGDLQPFL